MNDIYFVDKNNGWIVGDDGIMLYTKNGGVTSVEPSVNNPFDFLLSQNYPNPFNPSTKITWRTPVGGWQTLKVYDVFGNEIAVLVDEYKNSGAYETVFNASNFPSGVYFYRLHAGDFIETKKMIFLK